MLELKLSLEYNLLYSDEKFSVYGDVYGLLDVNKKIVVDSTKIDWSNELIDVNRFMIQLVGRVVILESKNIYTSSRMPHLFLLNEGRNRYTLFSSERDVIDASKKIPNRQALNRAISGHQGLIRGGRSGIFNDYILVQPMSSYSYRESSWDRMTFIKSTGLNFTNDNFTWLIDNILLLYAKKDSDINLALSGGADSAYLASRLIQLGLGHRVSAVHVKYFKGHDVSAKMCEEIKEAGLGYLEIIENKSKETSITNVFCGLGVDVSPEYKIGLGDSLKPINKIISGQNLDSLYLIDGFTPSSNEQGLIRVLKILFSIPFRIVFTPIFLKICTYLFGRRKILNSFLNVSKEHLKYLGIFDRYDPQNLREFEDLLPAESSIFKEILILKYYKFVVNTFTNYENDQRLNGVERILPFAEGPFLDFWYSRDHLDCSNLIYPKRFVIRGYISGDYNKSMRKHAKRIHYWLAKYLFRLMPFRLRTTLSRKFLGMTQLRYVLTTDQKELIKKAEVLLDSHYLDSRVRALISSVEKENESYTKYEIMLLFRVMNLGRLC